MILSFAARAWEDYLYWQQTDRAVLERINTLLKDTTRNPFSGIGKPEPLKNEWRGYWSRRIDAKHRLVYKPSEGAILVAQCRFHYAK